MADWLRTLPMPIGLLGFVDHWAAQMIYICGEAGYALPEQIAVLGIGNNPSVVQCCIPHLSSIAQDTERMVHTALAMLQARMDGGVLSATTVLVPPVGVVVRESTDVLAVQDRLVAKALRFIWTHYDLDISVDDVAREVGVPRYKLERMFRKDLNRGVNEEVVRKRLLVFGALLRTTDEPIGKIAAASGFRTLANLNRSFLRQHGVSPRTYREGTGQGKAVER